MARRPFAPACDPMTASPKVLRPRRRAIGRQVVRIVRHDGDDANRRTDFQSVPDSRLSLRERTPAPLFEPPGSTHPERRGASPTKDLGAQHARGDVFIFLDGHCCPEPGAIARLVDDVLHLGGRAIVTPTIAALDVRRWLNSASQVGHGYFLNRDFEYDSRTAGGATVHPVSNQTEYRNDDGTGAIETAFAHTWHSGTVKIQRRTTTLPVVPTSQNGSGTAATRKDYFDAHGNRTWAMDERGFITAFRYDVPTGAITQQIDDVDTSVVTGAPSGWTTPTGGGLNLVTDYGDDDLGRTTQELGPEHTIDIGGTPTAVRRATWTVYQNTAHEVWSASGYQKVSDSSFTLINPVSIVKRDPRRNVLQQIQATRASTSGKLLPTDSFPQSSYVRWTTYQYTECCLVSSMRVYHTIPTSGEGSQGTNYDETQYGYDSMKRRNRTVSPGGTITFDVLDARGQVIETWVGTNDDGATETDPSGGGADPDNNMVLVTGNQYDGGADGGDGNLTEQA